MRRLWFVVVALLLLATPVSAQDPNFRARIGRTTVVGANADPRITVTSPTSGTSHTTTASTLPFSGTVTSLIGTPITGVTWACATCTPTSGTAILVLGGLWQTPEASGGGTIFSANFDSGGQVAITATTPSVGTAWTNVVDTTSSADIYFQQKVGGYAASSDQWGGGVSGITYPALIDRATPDPSGVDYDVSVKVSWATSPGSDDPAGLIVGYADTSNSCAAVFYPSTAATELFLIKRVAGTVSTIASGALTLASGDIVKLSVRTGGDLEFFQNGTSRLTGTDAFCDDASGVGLGLGSLRDNAGDDLVHTWFFDDFTVVDQDTGDSGIGLASGDNDITFTATDADARTGVDTIRVTREATDSVAPTCNIDSPTTSPTQNTSTTAIVIAGTCTDNVEVVEVGLTCAECTPASAACTLSGSGTTKSFTCDSVNQASGANTLILIGVDAADNGGADTLVSTLSTDVTAPVVTITTNSGNNFTHATGTVLIQGSCTDAVGCAQILPSCDVCSVGSVTGLLSWSFTATLALNQANVVSVGARDQAGNLATPDTITVTHNAGTLTITTTTLPGGRDNSVYASQQLNATGGTLPYVWTNNGAGTSLNDSDAHCAGLVVSTAGVVSGTPTAEGTCDWTALVTDDAMATDTQALSIVVAAEGAEGPHDYFTDLLARMDCYKAWSLRPVEGETLDALGGDAATRHLRTNCTTGPYYENQFEKSSAPFYGYRKGTDPYIGESVFRITYNCATCGSGESHLVDTHVEAQDAARLKIPAFVRGCANTEPSGAVLPEALTADADDNVITKSCAWQGNLNRGIKIDDEIMVVSVANATSLAPVTVLRAQFGTTLAAHDAGATIDLTTNSLDITDQLLLPIRTDGSEDEDYLITWDVYHTSPGWAGWSGEKQAIKEINIGAGENQQRWFEFEPRFDSCAAGGTYTSLIPPGCVEGVHIGGAGARVYSPTMSPVTGHYPAEPAADPFLLEQGNWQRYWVHIQQRTDSNPANYTNATTLAAAMNDSQTTMLIDYPSATFRGNGIGGGIADAFYTPNSTTGGPAGIGRGVKIDDEIVTIVDCEAPTISPRSCTVVRGQHGTSAAAHLDNAAVQLSHDWLSFWMADENSAAVLIYDNFPLYLYLKGSTAALSGRIYDFLLEYDSSGTEASVLRSGQNFADWIFYLRNVVVLEGVAIGDVAPLLIQPVR